MCCLIERLEYFKRRDLIYFQRWYTVPSQRGVIVCANEGLFGAASGSFVDAAGLSKGHMAEILC